MSKINLTISGELVFEYNEDGSKTHEVMLKLKSGKLISLNIREKINFSEDFKKKTYSIYESNILTTNSSVRTFKTKEDANRYIFSLIEKQGYEINEEVIPNYDI